MGRQRPFIHTLAAIGAVLVSLLGPVRSVDAGSPSFADFEGRQIDLTRGWGAAHACAVLPTGTTCFRTEAELDAFLTTRVASASVAAATSICSSPLKLYDGTSYGGNLLSLSTRLTVISLANYGFDNVTSSYRIGSCDASLYAGISTNLYPGNTSAFAQAATMLTGWTNTISSLYIA